MVQAFCVPFNVIACEGVYICVVCVFVLLFKPQMQIKSLHNFTPERRVLNSIMRAKLENVERRGKKTYSISSNVMCFAMPACEERSEKGDEEKAGV